VEAGGSVKEDHRFAQRDQKGYDKKEYSVSRHIALRVSFQYRSRQEFWRCSVNDALHRRQSGISMEMFRAEGGSCGSNGAAPVSG
jgi:hypothetical protein